MNKFRLSFAQRIHQHFSDGAALLMYLELHELWELHDELRRQSAELELNNQIADRRTLSALANAVLAQIEHYDER